MKRIFSIFVATLLLSTTLLAATSFTVNGKKYTALTDAMKVCSEEHPVVFNANYTINSSKTCLSISDGKDYYLDLNGYTLTINGTAQNSVRNMGILITKGGLTIIGNGIIKSKTNSFMLIGDDTTPNNTRLTIGENITITNDTKTATYILPLHDSGLKYGGIVINFNGKMIANNAHGFYVNGAYTSTTNAPIINIGEKAEITCTKGMGIYAAGYAKWNFAGKIVADTCGIELRAGEFTMDGGSIEATMNKPADDQFNGNGSTSQACAIAVCQHSTKLPIKVTINGGSLKAYTPIYQANPQNNPQEAIDKVSVEVNNAQVFSTSKNIVWSANKKVVLNGGVYNMNPSAYAATGKVAVANTDEATKAEYPWMIGDVKAGVTYQTAGDWSTAANWSGVATAETPVTIAADVTVNGKAEAYGITIAGGKTITIKNGGVLVVGKNGISGITSADQLIIEDGGYLLISPAATTNNQPLATVKKVLNTKHKEAGTYVEGVESPYLREHIGLPTVGKHTTVCDAKLLGRQWNTVSGWENISEFATAFKGYSLTSEVAPQSPAEFAGQLAGNQDAVLSMPRQGFHFVANSWTAPLSTMEVLNQVSKLKNEGSTEASVKIYIPAQAKFVDVNKATLNIPSYQKWAALAPMQAFFLFANQPANITLNYEQAVWNNSVAQLKAAPKHVLAEDNVAVLITVSAKNGRTDEVYVYEGEPFHSTKMMNEAPNVNIYVNAENGNYSTFAAEDLDGTSLTLQTNDQTEYTLTFSEIKGEAIGIKDMETGVVTAMTTENTYTFTATANTTSRRFTITRKDVPSSIENAAINEEAKGVYTITGQFLGETVDLNTLPQGIYVVDGKKYVK